MALSRPNRVQPKTSPLEASAGADASTLTSFLLGERAVIIETATNRLRRSGTHYASADPADLRRRLEALYDQVVEAAGSRDVGGTVRYAQQLARARFSGGYDLSEVQSAINALEEAIWERIFTTLPATQLPRTLGIVSTILGLAKDALAREYVALATRGHVGSLDLRTLFAGTDGA
jgi:hypothetical protein